MTATNEREGDEKEEKETTEVTGERQKRGFVRDSKRGITEEREREREAAGMDGGKLL